MYQVTYFWCVLCWEVCPLLECPLLTIRYHSITPLWTRAYSWEYLVIMLAIGAICSIGATQSMLKDYTYSAKSRMITPYSIAHCFAWYVYNYVHVREKKVCMWKDNIPYQSYQYRYENEKRWTKWCSRVLSRSHFISSIMDQESVANSMWHFS